jgi:hypothetical protein
MLENTHALLAELQEYLVAAEEAVAQGRHEDLKKLNARVDAMAVQIRKLSAKDRVQLAEPLDTIITQLQTLQRGMLSQQRALVDEAKKMQHVTHSNRTYRARQDESN